MDPILSRFQGLSSQSASLEVAQRPEVVQQRIDTLAHRIGGLVAQTEMFRRLISRIEKTDLTDISLTMAEARQLIKSGSLTDPVTISQFLQKALQDTQEELNQLHSERRDLVPFPPLYTLPQELIVLIAQHANLQTRAALAATSQQMNEMVLEITKKECSLLITDVVQGLMALFSANATEISSRGECITLLNEWNDAALRNLTKFSEGESAIKEACNLVTSSLKRLTGKDFKAAYGIMRSMLSHSINGHNAAKDFFVTVLDVENAERSPYEFYRSEALRGIALELAQHGLLSRALEIVKTIPDEFYRSNTLGGIAQELTQQGQVDRALEVAKTIPNEEIRSRTLAELKKNRLIKT